MVRKLLERVMHVQDEFFMLHHNIGKVSYHTQAEIDNWRSDPDYGKHLDTLGQGIALATMKLRNKFSSEQEVRLVYSHSPGDNAWVKSNVKVCEKTCKHPFEWNGIIDHLIVGPNVENGGEQDVRDRMRTLGIECSIVSSSLWEFKG